MNDDRDRDNMKTIAVRAPHRLAQRLEAIARRENNHVSSVTRRLLTAALDREEAATPTAPRAA